MKTLERKYSKTERIIAKASFSVAVFLREVIIAALLGGIIAVLWIFRVQMEGWFVDNGGEAKYLTDDIMRWVLLGAGLFVLLCVIIESIEYSGRELIVTEDKIVYRQGIFNVKTVTIPLYAIRIVETKQNAVQRILGCGSLMIVSDAEKPYIIKNINSVDRLARRVMDQLALNRNRRQGVMSLRLAGGVQNPVVH